MSCLYGMFNFAFGINFLPSYINKEVMVERYMMTLLEYVVESPHEPSNIIGGFKPEGVLNFISARYFVQDFHSLSSILSSSVKYGLSALGNFGELLAQYFFLKSIFMCIDDSLEKVRKLAFQPITLKDFLLRLTGNEAAVNDFFFRNSLLNDSLVSFGYFEHFPENPIISPFDLMARCLFKGSAITLNSTFPGVNLLIPLVLKGGRISFIGVQVKFVKEEYAESTVNEALKKMKFSNIFKDHLNDRPFAFIILALGKYKKSEVRVLECVEIEKPQTRKGKRGESLSKRMSLEAPPVLLIRGVPASAKDLESLFNIAPAGASYRGIPPKYLEGCDRLHDLIRELPQIQELPKQIQSLGEDVSLADSRGRPSKRGRFSSSTRHSGEVGSTSSRVVAAGEVRKSGRTIPKTSKRGRFSISTRNSGKVGSASSRVVAAREVRKSRRTIPKNLEGCDRLHDLIRELPQKEVSSQIQEANSKLRRRCQSGRFEGPPVQTRQIFEFHSQFRRGWQC
jgi:hypothetical protein